MSTLNLSLKDKIELAQAIHYREWLKASKKLLSFAQLMNTSYDAQNFHKIVCNALDRFVAGEIKKLMINIPPQHGKSELSSRMLPAYLLGQNPDRKIALTSYGAEHAQGFNRDVQRIIDSEEYKRVFPQTSLNSKNVATNSKGNYKRTANIFEVVGHKGFLKTVGRGGALTGTTVDIGIIDDIYKDFAEANSKTIRDAAWHFYVYVFESRLHNDSQQLILNTRWHEDDLNARIIARDGLVENGGEWELISLPAIKDEEDDPLDTRDIGEALWESKHSFARLNKIRESSPQTFASLYQQRPAPLGGNMIKGEWLNNYDYTNFLANNIFTGELTVHAYMDTALSEKHEKNNDPTGILFYTFADGFLFLIDYHEDRWGFPDLIKHVQKLAKKWFKADSFLTIENKANGKSVRQQLISESYNINVRLDNIKGDKVMRLNEQLGFIASERVLFPNKGGWVQPFKDTLKTFPVVTHDEPIDTLTGAIRMCKAQNTEFDWTGMDFHNAI